MRRALVALLLAGVSSVAAAQTEPETRPAAALEDYRHVAISNGLVTAQVYPPGDNELYRGTRFDHAGVVFHVTYRGQDFNTYWFDHFLVDPTVTKGSRGTETACCAVSGPVEEFAAVGFDEAGPCPEGAQKTKCGRFLKPGVGIFTRDSDDPKRFPTLPALTEGKRTFHATKNSASFTQDITGDPSGYGYHYVKTVRLAPGKARLVITHEMKNTGSKTIETTVYCHNFLSLSPGDNHLVITAPFAVSTVEPLQPELVKIDGKTISYLQPIPTGTTVQSLLTGFGTTASDYDFTVRNAATGYAIRIRGDQPLARINMWSIDTTYSLEPYIAISLKPGETKRWTYTYDLSGPDAGAKP